MKLCQYQCNTEGVAVLLPARVESGPQPVQYWEPTSGRGSKCQHRLLPRLQHGRVDDSIATHWLWLRNGTSVSKKER